MEPYEIEDTSDWLGSPTELETCRQFLRMTENEVQELTLQLRKARQDIFGLVQMHAEVSKERDEAMRNLRERSAQLAEVRKELYDLKISASGSQREVERLRGILDGLTTRPKTII
ncbi:hypothetical protein [Pseudomonas prosekii]|uniref:Uncharacterized protein n=1 Tax=Pseudomonas prosekii TaxID=1148509 RepID=A0A1H1RZT0_9PSED|nr:hypothetical protein [Pseudomonas prosekii]SDS41267.1 hypothetical protein SAMN05216222_1402 [Pseudomonas prosekii]